MNERVFKVSNPNSVALNNTTLYFQQNEETTVEAERLDFDVLCDLWNAAMPLTLQRVADNAWLGALFFRLCRAQAVTADPHNYNMSYANRRQQSTTAAN